MGESEGEAEGLGLKGLHLLFISPMVTRGLTGGAGVGLGWRSREVGGGRGEGRGGGKGRDGSAALPWSPGFEEREMEEERCGPLDVGKQAPSLLSPPVPSSYPPPLSTRLTEAGRGGRR